MSGNSQRQNSVLRVDIGQIFLPPEITHVLFAGQTELGECFEIQFGGLHAKIEKSEGAAAVSQFLFINAHVAVRDDAGGLPAKFVLIQSQHFVVAQKAQREVVEFFHVAADEQRRSQQAPQADVRVLLVHAQARGVQIAPADLADDEHVGIVPISRPGKGRGLILLEADSAHAFPGVDDVARGAPAIAADRATPLPDVAHAVLAKAENNVPFLRGQGLVHDGIRLHQGGLLRIRRIEAAPALGGQWISGGVAALCFHFGLIGTPVVFQIIKTPLRVGRGVLPLVVETARAAATGPRPRRGIQADPQAESVHVVREPFHVGKPRVRHNLALRVAKFTAQRRVL